MAESDERLLDRLEREYRDALRARDAQKVSVIRMVKASIQNEEKVKQRPLAEQEVIEVVIRESKLRRESLAEFERGGRFDLAAPESAALDILAQYLPEQLSEVEIRSIVEATLAEMDGTALANPNAAVGLVMRTVMPRVRGRADGAMVNGIVRSVLAGAPGPPN